MSIQDDCFPCTICGAISEDKHDDKEHLMRYAEWAAKQKVAADAFALIPSKLNDTFAAMRKDGQGLSLDQETTIRRGLGLL